MLQANTTTVHASCVLVGRSAVLIRGASGSGKSRLALALIDALGSRARLVADDRVHLLAANGRLLAMAPDAIRGQVEIRGLGIRAVDYEPLALVSLVVDLGAADAARMPEDESRWIEISGVKLSRFPVAADETALPGVLAAINELTQG